MNFRVSTEDAVSAGLTTREALMASVLSGVYNLIQEGRANTEHSPEGAISEYWAERIEAQTERALKDILGRKQFTRHEKAMLDFVAEIMRLRTPAPLGTYPNEDAISEYRDFAEDFAAAAQSFLTNICAGMPISVGTSLATIFTDALHDREPFAKSATWAREWNESAAERHADHVIAFRRG